MKKRSIIDLIRHHVEKNEPAFRAEAMAIAHEFETGGDEQLAEYVVSLFSNVGQMEPQNQAEEGGTFFTRGAQSRDPLPLPQPVMDDLVGILNAVEKRRGLRKFLFEGHPGTGKTESAKQLARALGRTVLSADFSQIIDCKLGQTQKNVAAVFSEMKRNPSKDKVMFLFDEIDALALDRTDSRDVREMGRVTSAVLREFDCLPEDVILVATTNLYSRLDPALKRRFDVTVNFDRYTREDLTEIAGAVFSFYLEAFSLSDRRTGLLQKILASAPDLPMPGDIKNKIRLALAFSDENGPEMWQRLYKAFVGKAPESAAELKERGFSVREAELLTGISKSQVARAVRLKNSLSGDSHE